MQPQHDLLHRDRTDVEQVARRDQASDGDNWHHDSGRCRELLSSRILPLCRYFAYVQVADEEQNLWDEYAALAEENPVFAIRKATDAAHIYPVFRDLFKKEGAQAA